MSIMENNVFRSEIRETSQLLDEALKAEIRAHLLFTQRLGWIMICFLSFLLSVAAFHFSAISF